MPKRTNFTANGSTYYRSTATIGYKPDGTPIRKQFYGTSKKEAESKRDEYVSGLKQGLQVGFDKVLFDAAFRHWLEDIHRPAVKQGTYEKYEQVYRLYVSNCVLSGMKLIDVRPENMQIYVNNLVSITTTLNVHEAIKIMKIFFSYCIKVDALVKSPLRGIRLPMKPEKSDKNTALSDLDIDKLKKACEQDIRYLPYLLIVFTGLRSGEIRALTFADIDMNSGMIDVNKQVRYLNVNGEFSPVITPPKTKASMRKIPIADTIRPLLTKHIRNLTNDGTLICIDNSNCLLFPTSTGTYREQHNFLDCYKRLCVKLGIQQGRTIHSLRHTFCTTLARSGVSLLDASRLMGHENINVTAAIYSHVTDEDRKAAIKKLSDYFR